MVDRRKIPDIAFIANGRGTYEMWVGGRIGDYGVAEEDFADAIRRRRTPSGSVVKVVDERGAERIWTPR